MWHGSPCSLALPSSLALLAGSLLAGSPLPASHSENRWLPPAAPSPPLRQTAIRETETTEPCDFAAQAARFVQSLDAFRRGDASARAALLASAEHLRRHCGRQDPAEIAEFYAGLDARSRLLGIQLEDELDALHEAVAELATNDIEGMLAWREELGDLLARSEGVEDVPIRAHALSLDARLAVRQLEQDRGSSSADSSRELAGVEAEATSSIELFQRSGHVTPMLEPLWILARCALLRSDLDGAEDRFLELDEIAGRVNQDVWRERALLGLIGLARERGSLFLAEGLLDQLAMFRKPETCWSLAREVAAQRLLTDDGEGALAWLERFPPSEEDPEIAGGPALARAREEWRSLLSAAEMRSGRPERAAARLQEASPPEAAAAGQPAGSTAGLTRAAIYLESGEPGRALELLRGLRGVDVSAVSRMERLTLEGRALLALDRSAEAIPPLEEALAAAQTGPHDAAEAGKGGGCQGDATVASGSRVGEWLGLSAVETLGRAYVATGSPLRAAGLFESVHAPKLDRFECETAILDIAAGTDLGYVTWMVGADRSLAVHVAPDGTASATPIAIGRRGLERGTQRLRDALAARDHAGANPAWRPLAVELGETLLPETLGKGFADEIQTGATVVLAPHGVLERLPFEALLLAGDPLPLGIRTAMTVMTALRPGDEIAQPLDGPRADWIALGAPATRHHAPLPGARREIDRIGRLHPRWTAVTGEALTRSALEAALGGSRPLHLATHVAQVPGDAGQRSVAPWGFVVSGDDLVSAREVLELHPRLPLVTLTACGSADGVSIDGLSVRGLAQSMLESGTRAAVVTLWPIRDDAGERASVRLHAALLGRASPAEATRRAREFLWQLGAPPTEWAAYRALE